ncbi:MAG TPA: SDR family oxidoreductase [Acidobacteriaceae bacterium]|nr:SDR family oxidoreductase [Acidobacteriaceae bacterium]
MKMTGNTMLITGGGSGIGRGLAEAFHALGNTVVIAGRRKEMLEATAKANPGMERMTLDIEDAASIQSFAERVTEKYPKLNVLVNNAGIMKLEDLRTGARTDISEQTIAINLLGPIRLTTALLPLLQRQSHSTIMTVSSGLAFVPLAPTPTYCATKAAIHSYTQSLRYQLKDTTTAVVELIPPYVATDLMGSSADDPRAMPLDKFIAEVMEILKAQPDATEICVENVKRLRFAAESGHYDAVFKGLNDAMATGLH